VKRIFRGALHFRTLTTPSSLNLRRADRGGGADDAPRYLTQHRDSFGTRGEWRRLAGLSVAQRLSNYFRDTGAQRVPPLELTVFKKEYSVKIGKHRHVNTHASVTTTRTTGPVLVLRRVSRKSPPSSPLAARRFIGPALRGGLAERNRVNGIFFKDGFFDAELEGRFEPPRGGVEPQPPVAPPAPALGLRQPQAQRLVSGGADRQARPGLGANQGRYQATTIGWKWFERFQLPWRGKQARGQWQAQ